MSSRSDSTGTFGDGGSSTEQNPSHEYAQSGIYAVLLRVTDADAPQQVCRDTIPVYISTVVDPFCGATTSIRWGDSPLSVRFDAYPGLIGDPEPYTWSWRFGDDGTSTLQSPLHTYSGVGTYYAVATLHTPCGSYDCWPTLRVTALGTKTGVEPPVPRELHLDPPLPNPFRVMTGIGFVLPVAGRVRLTVSDVEGRLVATLVDGCRSAGHQAAVWQGRLDAGRPGLYFLRLEHGGGERVVRVARLE